ncbi:hypothetical protein PtrSN002B_011597 [Pyrenophora tritici-repentis]|nr:hypothetical protein A1F94_003929 [Pyrenophora tritici-repentis]KAI1522842.1 hypothetical protein PtrSN001A_011567 [Pyrenophora tritici-repentis]KAI1526687.1 hypothetical protein PtrSN002B_011597 [Pyrenophora tritici-repentis]KAI1559717.1 hypothetical protein PtrEW4_011596 [Pyrenophora tritici-repentis]KAI1560659.1 hypothetical protein PtrEW7m1_011493 [Pyrenophora tritici-repentis]
MTAPLMDHRGAARYFIGCQIDISHLMEGGRGLESFEQLLNDQEMVMKPVSEPLIRQSPLEVLKELSILLNDEELEIVKHRNRVRRNSIESNCNTSTRAVRTPIPRILVGMDTTFNSAYLPSRQFGRSGRLPGVYQNYILVRPFPSLRIIFTSESLRIPGLSQSRLMDRIGGPLHVRESLLDAFASGVGVTAKISWLTQPINRTPSYTQLNSRYNRNSDASDSISDSEIIEGKPRWIHCTPLLGSDSKPGVFMIVMVNKEVAGALNPVGPVPASRPMRSMDNMRDAWSQRAAGVGTTSRKLSSANLYADYLRSQGQKVASPSIDSRSLVDE